MKRFRSFSGPVLSSEERDRQGRVVRLAQQALGGVDEVRAFLNTRHPRLRARPLDLAIASEEGFARVAAEMARP